VPEASTEVRLLTFNTLMRGDVRRRLRALRAVLEHSGHDIVCLQEVMLRRHTGLVDTFGHHAWSGRLLLKGGLVLLSRWPIRTVRFVQYPRTGPARPEYLMRKGAQVAVVETPGGPFAVVNTHLSANRDDDWSGENRYTRIARAELGRLAEQVARLDPALPVVVTGDFNVPRTGVALAEFLATTGLTDVLAGDTEPTYRPTPGWPAPPAFDHVLIRPGTGRTLSGRAQIVLREPVTLPGGRQAYLSDHYGVEALLTLGSG
jgi:endonuclease/exonuclease/phosphatase family metal-dependent hydrolase